MIKRTPRSLLLVPDNRTASDWRETISAEPGFTCMNAEEIEESKRAFVNSQGVVAVMANRYDGIDFVGDECRLLIVHDLPRAMNLQERFLMSNLAATVLLNDRIQTRIVQAVGRCTRSATDYSAVVVLGYKLNDFFLERERRAFLHPEIQAELEFGINQSKDLEEADFLDNLGIFLAHGDDWNEADEQIIALRNGKTQVPLPGTDKLKAAVRHEVRYQYALWNGDHERAVQECHSILTALPGDDVKGYRAFWNYLAGSAAWLGAQNGIASLDGVARQFFSNASAAANNISWLRDLTRLGLSNTEQAPDDTRLLAVIEGLEARLENLGRANDRRFEQEVTFILTGLAQEDSDQFEEAHKRLGTLLGYTAGNSSATAAPDPWWIAGDLCFVAEDHSESKPNHVLGASKVRQAVCHPDWIRNNLTLPPSAEILAYIVSPCLRLDRDAATFAKDTSYWNIEDFRQWATHTTGVVRQLRSTFSGPGSLDWRNRAMQQYRDDGLDPASLKALLARTPLSSMPKTSDASQEPGDNSRCMAEAAASSQAV